MGQTLGVTQMKKRIVFTFDAQSLDALTTLSGTRTLASGLRDSLQIMAALQTQAALGFRELAVRNPRTGHERVLIVPFLQNI